MWETDDEHLLAPTNSGYYLQADVQGNFVTTKIIDTNMKFKISNLSVFQET